MSGRPYILEETTWKNVRDTSYEVAVLPWGATEAHNYHLPYSTDVVESAHIAAESARLAWEEEARVVVLPTVPFGVNTGQLDIKLDLNMNPSTQARVLNDLVESLSCQNIPKLLVINGHGGNSFKQMIREIQPRYPDVFLSTLSWYQTVDQEAFFDEPGDHAGEMETSLMLHLAPQWVLPLSEAGAGTEHKFKVQGLREAWAWAPRKWTEATEDTGVGNPAEATAEKGKQYLEAVTRKIGDFLVDLAGCDPRDLYQKA